MVLFSGRYYITKDASDRIQLPAKLKKRLPETTDELMLCFGDDGCIDVYMVDEYEKRMTEKINIDERNGAESRKFRRHAGIFSAEDIDKAGRIKIPDDFVKYAGLSKDIVINSNFDHFEIWDKKRWDDYMGNYSHNEFTSYSEELYKKEKAENK